MKIFKNKKLKHLIFAAIGALVGLIYYKEVGCQTGYCVITSHIGNTMVYTALIGFWISLATSGGSCRRSGSCSIDQNDDEDIKR